MLPRDRFQNDYIRAAGIWLTSYAELVYDEPSLQPPDVAAVTRASKVRLNVYQGILNVLKSTYPELVFEYALDSSDFDHNAYWTVYATYLADFEASMMELEAELSEMTRTNPGLVLEYQGKLGSLETVLKSMRKLQLVWPELSMSGPDALYSWKICFGKEEKAFQHKWHTKVCHQYEAVKRCRFAPVTLSRPPNDGTVYSMESNRAYILNLIGFFDRLSDRNILRNWRQLSINDIDSLDPRDPMLPYALTQVVRQVLTLLSSSVVSDEPAKDYIKQRPELLYPVANVRSIHLNGYPLPQVNRRYSDYIRELGDWDLLKDLWE